MGHTLRVTAAGLTVGLVLAYVAGRVMASMLFGVIELDAATYIALPLALGAVAGVVAAIGPARKAARLNVLDAISHS